MYSKHLKHLGLALTAAFGMSFIIPENAHATGIQPETYGAKVNDSKDDTLALQNALNEACRTSAPLTLKKGRYLTSNTLSCSGSKITINGNGAIIDYKKPLSENVPDWNEEYIMTLDVKGGTSNISNLTFDGIRNVQQNYNWTTRNKALFDKYGWTRVPLVKGLKINATKTSVLTDITAKNWYGGRVIHHTDYHTVKMNRIQTLNIGAHERENIGDHLHFGGHTGDAAVTITDWKASSKINQKNPVENGWIALVYENGSIQSRDKSSWQIDKNTVFNIKNAALTNFETGIHMENSAGNMYANIKDISYKGPNYMILSALRGETKIMTQRGKIDLTRHARNTYIHGVLHTQSMPKTYDVKMYNSVVDTETGKLLSAVYGNGSIMRFYGTTFNNVTGALAMNGSLSLYDSAVNIPKTNPRDTKLRLMDGGKYLSVKRSSFNFGSIKTAKHIPLPADYKKTGFTPPPFTTPALPGI